MKHRHHRPFHEAETGPLGHAPFPHEVERDVDERGISLVFPCRQPGPAQKKGAIFLILFGVFITGFMMFWMRMPIEGLLDAGFDFQKDGELNWPALGFSLFMSVFVFAGIPFFLMGLGLLLAGALLLSGRSRTTIGLTHDHLLYREQLGPLRWTWKRKRHDLQTLTVMGAAGGKNDGPDLTLHGIRAQGSGKDLTLATAYDEDLLKGVAYELGKHLRGVEMLAEKTDLPPGLSKKVADPKDLAQPPDTQVKMRRRLDGVEFETRPTGLGKGSHGIFTFGVIWTLFTGGIVVALTFMADDRPPLFAIAVLALFVLIGLSMLLAGYNMGTRTAKVSANAGTLHITRKSRIFGAKEKSWKARELSDIRFGSSGTEINDRPINELQVIDTKGKKAMKLLSQLSDEEIRWVRAHLVQALWPRCE